MEPYEIVIRVKEGKPTGRRDLDRARKYYEEQLAEYRAAGWKGLAEAVERDLAILNQAKAWRKVKPREMAEIFRDLDGARLLGNAALVAEYEAELSAAMDGQVYAARTGIKGRQAEGQQIGLEV